MPIKKMKNGRGEVTVKRVESPEELEKGFQVRKTVFMEEQMISEEDEFDGLDSGSFHYLALTHDIPAGAARWRVTEKGIKLERFCVLKEFRRFGIAGKLVEAVLNDCRLMYPGARIYLYAQTDVKELYEKHGFSEIGEEFIECEIAHIEMEFLNKH